MNHGTSRHPAGRARAGAAFAALLVSAALLAGCSASGSGGHSSDGYAADKSGGSVPAPAATDAAGKQAKGDAPAPDYLSTFALDVDTASYGYARRVLADGQLPKPETVRPEEFVNSFKQGYARPGGDGFSVSVDGARTGGGAEDWSLLRVGLATKAADDTAPRPPAALTFVVDISGSMAETGRLDLVRTSLAYLTEQLRDDDSVALVTFSDEAETVLPMTALRGHRTKIREAVEALHTDSATNVAAGVERGYDEAVEGRREGATNRVVLLSDALANTGETDADAILERIDSSRREYGITLFGVGVGSDYGDALMERLADKGDGNTTYVADEAQARKVFVDQLPAHVQLRARDAKAQVAFDRKTVQQFKLIGYEDRAVADEDFRDNSVDGGEVGPGHTVTALYAVHLRKGASGHVATATVRWLDPKTRKAREETGSVETDALGGALWGAADARLQVTAAAAYFADILRGGTLPGAPGLGELTSRTRKLAAETEDGSVAKLADAISQAAELTGEEGEMPSAPAEGEMD
ncbi:von Willebrand factor type A domain-containing protein [Streptomyces sp. NBC_00102]|uniref:vWA domain-containing protein n=1 Tax=Streptomyces sp. NBC_00102 TaxID=2975652 RepID=UPI00224CDC6C|nr:von Willebrand factor type A domain-containing protein [Streptomyces sp. NBC_00102]MCX5397094.1 von Willebrand factor type A domain-containing protein [Streptomyces sp. NBC_00102]